MNAGFLAQYGSEIATLTLEHLWLTGAAMLFATAISVPAGVWLARSPRWAKPVIGLTNVLQTIPSLAMFGFLLPLPWLGGTRRTDCDCCTLRLCPAAHFAQYLRRNPGH